MSNVLDHLEPKGVFQQFEALTRIPRGSGNEQAVSNYLLNFARQRGLHAVQDDAHNVVVDLPPSLGYEREEKYLLQSHMDMVCAKDDDTCFDFTKEPLHIYVDGDYVKARHTTLGADNGIGMALMLAIMDDHRRHLHYSCR